MTIDPLNIVIIGFATLGFAAAFGLRYFQLREDIRDRQIDREIRIRSQMNKDNSIEKSNLGEVQSNDIVRSILIELRH